MASPELKVLIRFGVHCVMHCKCMLHTYRRYREIVSQNNIVIAIIFILASIRNVYVTFELSVRKVETCLVML